MSRSISTSLARHAAVSSQKNTPEYDLVVVGAGASGTAAAIAAAEKGAAVLLMDRGHGGGTSRLSGGIVYTGGGTPYQKAAGYDETPENMFNYLKMEVQGAVDDETLKRFCDNSVDNLAWLEKCGARFGESLCPYKVVYPPDRHFLYFSGNEKAYPYNQHATPAPRGHRTMAPGLQSGATLWAALNERAKALGVDILRLSHADQVIVENGRVQGVRYRVMPNTSRGFKTHRRLEAVGSGLTNWLPPIGNALMDRANEIWKRNAEARTVRTPSVVLAAGGFIRNRAMVREYNDTAEGTLSLGNRGDDGAGIRLGQEVGGQVSHMESLGMWRFLSPPEAFLQGIALGPSGERIANEDLYGGTFTKTMVAKAGGRGCLIMDSATWKLAKKTYREELHLSSRPQAYYTLYWGYRKARSLDRLAQKMGISPEGLRRTITAYNTGIRNGTGDPAHKATQYCAPLSQGPFYAIDISIRPSIPYPVAAFTLGGLKVEGKTGLVLTKSGKPLPGLYAAGRNAVGLPANSYISGLSLADCIFSGRRAGEHAALMRGFEK